MNSRKLFALAAASLCAGAAHAADSVTIYGLIDAGLTRYSDAAVAGGSTSLTKMDTGVANANRIGFRGVENLGGGVDAFFTLETGYSLDDGTLGQGGLLFGRQAFVGLGNAVGSVSVGRQYDFMISQNAYATGAATVAGLLAFGLHANGRTGGVLNDRIYAGDRVNNSVKFQSQKFGGWSVGAMYGLGEVAGNSAAGRSYSARVAYDDGPLSAGFALTDLRDAAGLYSTRIYGLGANYQWGAVRPFALVTRVRSDAGAKPGADNYEIGATWAAGALVDLSAGAQHQSRNNGIGGADQLTLVANYKLSRRTNVYAVAAFLRDKGYPAQTTAALGAVAGDGSQNALRVGVRHLF
ncbi:porin [Pseudoduganella namucuonensis]|uniref:Outer membrane protein (Porin) n=1 Tax=Pseudoduganella namucuonensis TaxID=1035707 RepID=A0A1I7LZY0_9BURK|nr:porin [Pseudoduganella namucuonensis]SFV15100.1 Outer membrane protein (porin) [Pseudoduganella namucuonensis]